MTSNTDGSYQLFMHEDEKGKRKEKKDEKY